RIDQLLHGVDLLLRIAASAEDQEFWQAGSGSKEIDAFLQGLQNSLNEADDFEPAPVTAVADIDGPNVLHSATNGQQDSGDRMLRVTAAHLNQLVSLSGES